MNPGALVQGVVGAALAVVVLWDAFETVLVPRRIGRRFRLTSAYYRMAWRLWRRRSKKMAANDDPMDMLW